MYAVSVSSVTPSVSPTGTYSSRIVRPSAHTRLSAMHYILRIIIAAAAAELPLLCDIYTIFLGQQNYFARS